MDKIKFLRRVLVAVVLYVALLFQTVLWAEPLNVPFVAQFNTNACGAAALEMVYKYYGKSDITQQEIFNKLKEKEPELRRENRISTDHLVSDAQARGFRAFWDRVDYSEQNEALQVLKYYLSRKTPVIVCQQFTKKSRKIGHFRVVVDVDEDQYIYFYDPDEGHDLIKWPIDQFMDYWQPTGQNVTGGVYIVIEKNNQE